MPDPSSPSLSPSPSPSPSGEVPVRDAATVVLLRDGDAGVEVFLQRRVDGMVFAAGMTVFPGGAAEPGDDDLVATAVRETEEETGLRLDPAALVLWARWVTPEGERRRYDTRFYVTVAPPGAQPEARGTEMDAVSWATPAQTLARLAVGDLKLLPPTYVTLRELASHGTAADVMAAAAEREVVAIHPTVRVDDLGLLVELPDGEVLRQ